MINAFDFKGVFDKEVYLTFYRGLQNEEATLKEVDKILSRTPRKPVNRIPDAGCGFGRHSNVFSKKRLLRDGGRY